MVVFTVITAILVMASGVFDVFTTNLALEAGRVERNPIMRAFQKRFKGYWAVPKLALHLLVALFILFWSGDAAIAFGVTLSAGVFYIAYRNLDGVDLDRD